MTPDPDTDYTRIPEWQWLESTFKLQSETYGYNLIRLYEGSLPFATPNQTKALAEYLSWNQVAAVQELAEVREEFSWKPWTTDAPFVKRDRVIAEIVDTMHFLGNMLVGLGITDEQFWEAYRRKQQRNRERQASGTYSAQKGGLAAGSDL